VEIRLLKKIFQPDEAELLCDLKLKFETAGKIAQNAPAGLWEGLEEKLTRMWEKGQVFGVQMGDVSSSGWCPWAFDLRAAVPFMDRDMAEMCEEFMKVYGRQFFDKMPQLMRVIPLKKRSLPDTKP